MVSRGSSDGRRLASGWRSTLASLLCVAGAVAALTTLLLGARDLPQARKRFELVTWSGPPPAAGSEVVEAPDEQHRYFLSRGPVVHLIELGPDHESVRRAWVWRLEDSESLRKRWPPTVTDDWVTVSDLHGDLVSFDRHSGRATSGRAEARPLARD